MKILGIIPARYASVRLPGKPLADIGGKTMIERVTQAASLILDEVFVATDDERILTAVQNFGGKSVLTSTHHKSGTDRCAEALQIITTQTDQVFDIVINIQGDEPFLHPSHLQLLAQCFVAQEVQIATLIKKITDSDTLLNPNRPKVLINNNGDAIYFSRTAVPYFRGQSPNVWHLHHTYYAHIGLYAYRSATLLRLTNLAYSSLELAEGLEQNRWIENGYQIRTALTDKESLSVDTPEDLDKARDLLLGIF